MNKTLPIIPIPIPWSATAWSKMFLADLVADPRFTRFVNSWTIACQEDGEIKRCLHLLLGVRKELKIEIEEMTRLACAFELLDDALVCKAAEFDVSISRERFNLIATIACTFLTIGHHAKMSPQDRAVAAELITHWQVEMARAAIDALSEHFGTAPWAPQHLAG